VSVMTMPELQAEASQLSRIVEFFFPYLFISIPAFSLSHVFAVMPACLS
jgi:hypothetical protein